MKLYTINSITILITPAQYLCFILILSEVLEITRTITTLKICFFETVQYITIKSYRKFVCYTLMQ